MIQDSSYSFQSSISSSQRKANMKKRQVSPLYSSSSSPGFTDSFDGNFMQQDQIPVLVTNMDSSASSSSLSSYSSSSASQPILTMTSLDPEGNKIPHHNHHHVMTSSSSTSDKRNNRKHTHIKLIEENSTPSPTSTPSSSTSTRRKRKRKRKHHHRQRHNNNNQSQTTGLKGNSNSDSSSSSNNGSKNRRFRGIIDSISSNNDQGKESASTTSSTVSETTSTPSTSTSSSSGDNNQKMCQYHLMDHCSWPQCNRGCPRLYNPLTGKKDSDGLHPKHSLNILSFEERTKLFSPLFF